jgi:hypothetical protein
VTITAGDREKRDGARAQDWRASKLILVWRSQALFHSGDLKIARALPEAALAAQLQDFRASISEAGYTSFGARVDKDDDPVLALAIARW